MAPRKEGSILEENKEIQKREGVMNTRIVREGSVQGFKSQEETRDRMFQNISGSVIKTAGDKAEKADAKAEKQEAKQETKEEKFKAKMTKKEAEELGFFKAASQCGWGIYQISDLDGGAGSVWYLEKDADGIEYLVKQTDSAGDVVRRAKATA
jgi:hypothetical protein